MTIPNARSNCCKQGKRRINSLSVDKAGSVPMIALLQPTELHLPRPDLACIRDMSQPALRKGHLPLYTGVDGMGHPGHKREKASPWGKQPVNCPSGWPLARLVTPEDTFLLQMSVHETPWMFSLPALLTDLFSCKYQAPNLLATVDFSGTGQRPVSWLSGEAHQHVLDLYPQRVVENAATRTNWHFPPSAPIEGKNGKTRKAPKRETTTKPTEEIQSSRGKQKTKRNKSKAKEERLPKPGQQSHRRKGSKQQCPCNHFGVCMCGQTAATCACNGVRKTEHPEAHSTNGGGDSGGERSHQCVCVWEKKCSCPRANRFCPCHRIKIPSSRRTRRQERRKDRKVKSLPSSHTQSKDSTSQDGFSEAEARSDSTLSSGSFEWCGKSQDQRREAWGEQAQAYFASQRPEADQRKSSAPLAAQIPRMADEKPRRPYAKPTVEDVPEEAGLETTNREPLVQIRSFDPRANLVHTPGAASTGRAAPNPIPHGVWPPAPAPVIPPLVPGGPGYPEGSAKAPIHGRNSACAPPSSYHNAAEIRGFRDTKGHDTSLKDFPPAVPAPGFASDFNDMAFEPPTTAAYAEYFREPFGPEWHQNRCRVAPR